MSMKVTMKRANPGWAKVIAERVSGLANKEVVAGFPRGSDKASSTYDNGWNVLNNAITQNFGNSRIPARPFMDKAVAILEADKAGNGAALAKQVIEGKVTARRVLKQIGLIAEDAIRTAITDGDYTPNAKATIIGSVSKLKSFKKAKKGGKKQMRMIAEAIWDKKPLIDTGKLRQSVSSVVRDRSN